MKLFYKIWVDAIEFEKSKPLNNGNWKLFALSYMTILVGINIATIYEILFSFGIDITKPAMYILDFIVYEKARNLLWSFIMMFIPSFFINYMLIIFNKKYEFLLEKYQSLKPKKGNLLRIYFLTSFILFIGISLVKKFLS